MVVWCHILVALDVNDLDRVVKMGEHEKLYNAR